MRARVLKTGRGVNIVKHTIGLLEIDGLPVIHANSFGISWLSDDLKVGDVFYFITENEDTGEKRTFKLKKVETDTECSLCPLRSYRCHGIGCYIEEVK